MNENKKYDELEKLTSLDDAAVEEIAEKYPALDEAAKDRIKKLCEEKMKMNNINVIKNEKAFGENVVNNVEVISRGKWYRSRFMSIAAAAVLTIGIGASLYAVTRKPADNDNVIVPGAEVTTVVTEETSITEPTEVTTEAPTEDDTDLVVNGFNIYDYPEYVQWIKNNADNMPMNYEEYKSKDDVFFSLIDLDNDGDPEMLIYLQDRLYNAYDKDLTFGDTLDSLLSGNFSCVNELCEGNVIHRSQGNPPFVYETFYMYDGTKEGSELVTIAHDFETVDDAKHCYILDKLDYNVELGSENSISHEEAKNIMSKYKPVIPEKICAAKVK